MQHFSTLGNAAYKFFKTFRANPASAECVCRDRGGGGGEYFRKERVTTANHEMHVFVSKLVFSE